jgi:hypothetical protein
MLTDGGGDAGVVFAASGTAVNTLPTGVGDKRFTKGAP